MKFSKISIPILASAFLIALDFISKYFAEIYLKAPLVIQPGVFRLSLSYNTGTAFSTPIPNAVMIFAAPLLLAFVIWLISSNFNLNHWLTKLCLILLISGAIGNLINRIFTGAVIDFIAFSFWPSFNLADSYLTVGAFLLVIFYGKISITNK
ncbi:signal peptidase II [Candidatus Peregrinibacteria bacterium]|nr:signal peptidase II [Candidatus Peregrinibacteria bacterium]